MASSKAHYTARFRKTEYRQLASQLYGHVDRDLERVVLPILRVLWPTLLRVEPRSRLDGRGIDFFVGSPPHFDTVVQCKGSLKDGIESGLLASIAESARDFRESGLTTARYVLFTNRPAKSKDVHARVRHALDELHSSGVAEVATHWDVNGLLEAVFLHLLERVLHVMRQGSDAAVRQHLTFEPPICDELSSVPCQVSQFVSDPYRIRERQELSDGVRDPCELLFNDEQGMFTILLGEFGFGKTTSLLRALASSDRTMLFLPAARIPKETSGTKPLIISCVNFDDFGSDYDPTTRPLALKLARGVLEYLLVRGKEPWALLIDGLDESAVLNRPRRLRALLNALREIRVPIVLSARSEWWHLQEAELGLPDAGPKRREPVVYRWKVVELKPWTDYEIARLTRSFAESLVEPEARSRIEAFASLVEAGGYGEYYGDIPRRPLFLRWILETLEAEAARKTNRAELFERWMGLKLRRDFALPQEIGALGRAGILQEEEKFAVRRSLAIRSMEAAAGCMLETCGQEPGLLPDCGLDDLIAACPELHGLQDPSGLVTNSLLRPIDSPAEDLRLAFTHRAYQEYFLARHLRRKGADPTPYPDTIREWHALLDAQYKKGLPSV